MTLDKTYLVHYGLCPKAKEVVGQPTDASAPSACHPFVGIPYHSGSPVETSRFGTDLESLNYTFQSHLELRNVHSMFKLEVERLKSQFRKNRSPNIRAKFALYFDTELWVGQIFNFSDAEIETRAQIVSTRPTLVFKPC